jgi:hypothetical protein
MVLHRDAAAGRQRIDEQITPSSSNPSVAFGCSRARRVNVKATQLDGGAGTGTLWTSTQSLGRFGQYSLLRSRPCLFGGVFQQHPGII